MSPARRIILNIITTYGRSFISLLCGVFTIRWVLAGLGTVDYGLYGVVGGLTGFVMYVSYILQGATSRFYAFSIGQAQGAGSVHYGVEQCRKWFNTSLCIHVFAAVTLFAIGYYVGIWAIRNFLVIPPDRVDDCVWVFRYSCLSCFLAMITVPYYGMYIAKQFIAELTIYGVFTTICGAATAYYMFTHQGDWLRLYAGLICLFSCVPNILIVSRAMYIFPECKIKFKYWFSIKRFRELSSYAGWNFLGATGRMLQSQGVAVLINKFFGASINAGYTLANTINNQCQALVSALRTAFIPAVTTLCGAGEKGKMEAMALRACKFSASLAMLFTIPISLELRQILEWWLIKPPPAVVGLCWCIMVAHVIENIALGQSLAICAEGRVAKYQILSSLIRVMILPISWVMLAMGGHVYCIGGAIIVFMGLYTVMRVILAKSLVDMRMGDWFKTVLVPCCCVAGITLFVGLIPVMYLPASIFRVPITGFVCELVYMPLVWCLILNKAERSYIVARIPFVKNR